MLVGEIQRHDAGWACWFDAQGVEPLLVSYEDLAADTEGVTRATLDFLGVQLPEDAAVTPLTRRQADAVNEEWAARYRSLT